MPPSDAADKSTQCSKLKAFESWHDHLPVMLGSRCLGLPSPAICPWMDEVTILNYMNSTSIPDVGHGFVIRTPRGWPRGDQQSSSKYLQSPNHSGATPETNWGFRCSRISKNQLLRLKMSLCNHTMFDMTALQGWRIPWLARFNQGSALGSVWPVASAASHLVTIFSGTYWTQGPHLLSGSLCLG